MLVDEGLRPHIPNFVETDKQLKGLAGIHYIEIFVFPVFLDRDEFAGNMLCKQVQEINVLMDSLAADLHCVFVAYVYIVGKEVVV